MAITPLSILVLDIGSSETSAYLMDTVDGRYHVIAVGSALSTATAPVFDAWEGCVRAVRKLEAVCGRTLLFQDNSLISPPNQRGDGVEKVVMTASAGPQLKIIAAGLLEEVSLTSCRHLAASVGGKLIDQISLSDRSSVDRHLDQAIKHRPELILLAGGTEGGASRAVLKTAELIQSLCQLIPQGKRPVILYTGNQAIAPRVEALLKDLTLVFSVANIRPSIEQENLAPAQYTLAEIMASIRTQQVAGLENAAQNSHLPLLPSSYTFGRTFRYLSLANPRSQLPVMGIDVGSDYTVVADAFKGDLRLNVLPYGVGGGIDNTLNILPLEEVLRWLPADIHPSMARDYLYQKVLFPNALPITEETFCIEQAFLRVLLQLAMTRTRKLFNTNPTYELLAAAGAIISGAPTLQHSLMAILDGVQPIGMTTVVLDQNHLLSAIGAAAGVSPLVPVHALESGMLPTLATVISPISEVRAGRTILYGKLLYGNQKEVKFEVKKGEIKVLPLAAGETAMLELNPSPRTWLHLDRSMSAGGMQFKVVGGWCGLVIDGRGRPLELPEDKQARIAMLQRWMQQLQGKPIDSAAEVAANAENLVAQELQPTQRSGS